MIAQQRFDVAITAQQAAQQCLTQTVVLQRVNPGFAGQVVDFDSHSAHHVVIAATADDEIKSWPMAAHIQTVMDADISDAQTVSLTGGAQSYKAATAQAGVSSLPEYSFLDVQLDDDDDFDFDDDDDDYDSGSGASGYVPPTIPTIPPTTDGGSKGLKNIQRVVTTRDPAVLFALTNDGTGIYIDDSTIACESTGSYGVYRINLNNTEDEPADTEGETDTVAEFSFTDGQLIAESKASATHIPVDTMASVSGYVPVDPPPVDNGDGGNGDGGNGGEQPSAPSSQEASCLHADLTDLALSRDASTLIFAGPNRAFSLNADTLVANDGSFTPFNTSASIQSISGQQ